MKEAFLSDRSQTNYSIIFKSIGASVLSKEHASLKQFILDSILLT